MQKRALIIEDSENFVDFYSHFLKEYDCIVEHTDTVEDAIQLLKKKNFDIFIVDIKLKTPTRGTEIIGHGAPAEKTIVISSYLDAETVSKLTSLYKVDPGSLFSKPVDAGLLKTKISQIMNNGKPEKGDSPAIKEEHVVTTEDETVGKIIVDNIEIFWKLIRGWVNTITFKGFVVGLVLLMMIINFVPIYNTWHMYNHNFEHHERFVEYCEERFENFKSGDRVTSNTYVEHIHEIGDLEIVLKSFPDGVFQLIVYSTEEDPKEYWIGEENEFYLRHIGIEPGKKKSFLEIFWEHVISRFKI